MTSRSKALGKNGPRKTTSELASLLHTNASSLEEGEKSRSSQEVTPALSKAPSTSTLQDLEERKLTLMFEFLMEQQQRRDEERGRDAEERENVRKREAVEREEARKREEEYRGKRDRLWMRSLQEMEDERRRKQMEWEERREKREAERREQEENDRVAVRLEEQRALAAAKLEEQRELAEVRHREQEVLIQQQRELREANAEMHERHQQRQSQLTLLGRLPKYNGEQNPAAFLQALEKQLDDHNFPRDQWQAALENCLTQKAQQLYWNLTVPEERGTYLLAKNAIVRCMGMPKARRLDQVHKVKRAKEESVAQMWEESVLHVNAFLEEDTKDERSAFIWKLTRTLAKCKQECANAVYDKKPKTATEVIEAINVWEQQHGFSGRVWEKKPFQPFVKKGDVSSSYGGYGGSVFMSELGVRMPGGVKVKVEKPEGTDKQSGGSKQS